MKCLHLLGGHLDAVGGVADYTSVLAEALSARGVTTHIWDAAEPGVRRQVAAALARDTGPLVVQYVPGAFGWRGANVPFCLWLLSLRRQGHDVRVMFHEPYFYFSAHPLRNGLAVVQRVMAAVLLRAATVCYVSTSTWERYLGPYAPAGTRFVPLPVPSTIPRSGSAAAQGEARARLLAPGTRLLVGHFGTFGEHIASTLSPILGRLLDERPDVTVVCAGRGSEGFVKHLRRGARHGARLVAAGAVHSDALATMLAACDVLIQPYPDGVTTRRTSVMAGLINGVPTVTSEGVLTEALWRRAGAATMAPAHDNDAHVRAIVSLLDDERLRGELSTRSREFYDRHCAIDATVDVLVGARLAATA
jgi:glycosyltransferase involved in cell wall biosynthesis